MRIDRFNFSSLGKDYIADVDIVIEEGCPATFNDPGYPAETYLDGVYSIWVDLDGEIGEEVDITEQLEDAIVSEIDRLGNALYDLL